MAFSQAVSGLNAAAGSDLTGFSANAHGFFCSAASA